MSNNIERSFNGSMPWTFNLRYAMVWIFILPTNISTRFCIPTPIPTTLQMVDWFEDRARRQHLGEVRRMTAPDIERVRMFIRKKRYYMDSLHFGDGGIDRKANFLVVAQTGEAFLVDSP